MNNEISSGFIPKKLVGFFVFNSLAELVRISKMRYLLCKVLSFFNSLLTSKKHKVTQF